MPGTILGSVQYFSPEQARGEGTTAGVRRLRPRARPVRGAHRPSAVVRARRPRRSRWPGSAPPPRRRAPSGPTSRSRSTRSSSGRWIRTRSVATRTATAFAAALERLLVAPAPRAGRVRRSWSRRPRPGHRGRPRVRAVAGRRRPTFADAAGSAGPVRSERGRTPLPVLAMLALAGVLVGAVAVAAFPGTGAGTIAIASDAPSASLEPDPTARPTPRPDARADPRGDPERRSRS